MLNLDRILAELEAASETDRTLLAERHLPSLIDALGDPHKEFQVKAASCLEALLSYSPAVAPALAAAMSAPDPWRAWGAAFVAARAGLWLPSMRSALVGALGAEDRDVRWAAAGLTVKLGRTHAEAVALLREAVANGRPVARRMAAYALGAMGAYTAVETDLVRALKDPDRDVRRAAVLALDKLPALSAEAVAAVAALRGDPDRFVRRASGAVAAKRGR